MWSLCRERDTHLMFSLVSLVPRFIRELKAN